MSGSGNDFFSFPTIHVFFNATKQKRLVSKKVRESTKRSALVLRTIRLPRLNSDDTSTSSRVGQNAVERKKNRFVFFASCKSYPRKRRTPFFATRATYRLTGRPTLLIFTNEGREKEVAPLSYRLFVRDSKQGHVAC